MLFQDQILATKQLQTFLCQTYTEMRDHMLFQDQILATKQLQAFLCQDYTEMLFAFCLTARKMVKRERPI